MLYTQNKNVNVSLETVQEPKYFKHAQKYHRIKSVWHCLRFGLLDSRLYEHLFSSKVSYKYNNNGLRILYIWQYAKPRYL